MVVFFDFWSAKNAYVKYRVSERERERERSAEIQLRVGENDVKKSRRDRILSIGGGQTRGRDQWTLFLLLRAVLLRNGTTIVAFENGRCRWPLPFNLSKIPNLSFLLISQ
jgi:hypothetical protein